MRRWLVAALVTASLIVGSVTADAASPQAATESCTAKATKALVHEFVGDYNTGRLARVDRLWAPAPRFQWYSTGGAGKRLGDASKNRSILIPYFRSRVRKHERILITQLGAGYNARQNHVDFGGKLLRTADDMGRRGPQDFKGAADCKSGHPLLIVWSM